MVAQGFWLLCIVCLFILVWALLSGPVKEKMRENQSQFHWNSGTSWHSPAQKRGWKGVGASSGEAFIYTPRKSGSETKLMIICSDSSWIEHSKLFIKQHLQGGSQYLGTIEGKMWLRFTGSLQEPCHRQRTAQDILWNVRLLLKHSLYFGLCVSQGSLVHCE